MTWIAILVHVSDSRTSIAISFVHDAGNSYIPSWCLSDCHCLLHYGKLLKKVWLPGGMWGLKCFWNKVSSILFASDMTTRFWVMQAVQGLVLILQQHHFLNLTVHDVFVIEQSFVKNHSASDFNRDVSQVITVGVFLWASFSTTLDGHGNIWCSIIIAGEGLPVATLKDGNLLALGASSFSAVSYWSFHISSGTGNDF